MQRIICSMEVALFSSQLIRLGTMKKEKFEAHSNLVVFYIIFYIRQWTQSPFLFDNAVNNLTLPKELKEIHYPPFEGFKQDISAKLECSHQCVIFILWWFIVFPSHSIVSVTISPENGNFGARFLSKLIIKDPKYVLNKFNINMLISHL